MNIVWNGMEVSLEDDAFSSHPLALPIPNATLRGTSSVRELDHWLAIGEAWADIVAHFLPDNPFVVDLGCGCGKLARFLYLNPRIRYFGLDVFLPVIAWCQRAFRPLAGQRFQFEHFDGHSSPYNPQGSIDPATYVFPFHEATVDMVVCGSLFTHLVEPVCRHYLREIRRVLKAGGRAIISIHTEPGPATSFSGDESRIDIAPDYFKQLAANAGLRELQTVGIVYGQMVIVFENAES
jgi:SAM-dependent methyltransferase